MIISLFFILIIFIFVGNKKKNNVIYYDINKNIMFVRKGYKNATKHLFQIRVWNLTEEKVGTGMNG